MSIKEAGLERVSQVNVALPGDTGWPPELGDPDAAASRAVSREPLDRGRGDDRCKFGV